MVLVVFYYYYYYYYYYHHYHATTTTTATTTTRIGLGLAQDAIYLDDSTVGLWVGALIEVPSVFGSAP